MVVRVLLRPPGGQRQDQNRKPRRTSRCGTCNRIWEMRNRSKVYQVRSVCPPEMNKRPRGTHEQAEGRSTGLRVGLCPIGRFPLGMGPLEVLYTFTAPHCTCCCAAAPSDVKAPGPGLCRPARPSGKGLPPVSSGTPCGADGLGPRPGLRPCGWARAVGLEEAVAMHNSHDAEAAKRPANQPLRPCGWSPAVGG